MQGVFRLVRIEDKVGVLTRLEWQRVDCLISEPAWIHYYRPGDKAELVAAYNAAQQWANRNDIQEG